MKITIKEINKIIRNAVKFHVLESKTVNTMTLAEKFAWCQDYYSETELIYI